MKANVTPAKTVLLEVTHLPPEPREPSGTDGRVILQIFRRASCVPGPRLCVWDTKKEDTKKVAFSTVHGASGCPSGKSPHPEAPLPVPLLTPAASSLVLLLTPHPQAHWPLFHAPSSGLPPRLCTALSLLVSSSGFFLAHSLPSGLNSDVISASGRHAEPLSKPTLLPPPYLLFFIVLLLSGIFYYYCVFPSLSPTRVESLNGQGLFASSFRIVCLFFAEED